MDRFVLSNLQSRLAGNRIHVSVDWKLAQGGIEPGKSYRMFVFAKVASKPSLSSVHEIESDLNDQQGTAEGDISARDANGQHVVSHVVVSEQEGYGSRMLASGELKAGRSSSAAQPPVR